MLLVLFSLVQKNPYFFLFSETDAYLGANIMCCKSRVWKNLRRLTISDWDTQIVSKNFCSALYLLLSLHLFR